MARCVPYLHFRLLTSLVGLDSRGLTVFLLDRRTYFRISRLALFLQFPYLMRLKALHRYAQPEYPRSLLLRRILDPIMAAELRFTLQRLV